VTPDEVVELVRWIEQQHRVAKAEAERLLRLAAAVEVTAGGGAEDLRRQFAVSADVAAAGARLEAWNDVRATLKKALRTHAE
jgi:hypothetical protein